MADRFTWIPLYEAIARSLLDWQERQGDLIRLLEDLRGQGRPITPLTDQDSQGGRSLLTEIDPFTFLGVFNRRIRTDQRLAILQDLRTKLGVQPALPTDFDGVPILNNQRSWFIAYAKERQSDDVQRLWRVFRLALGPHPYEDDAFRHAFDEALEVRGTNINLTMGLFWIRPEAFLSLDERNRRLLDIKLPGTGLTSTFYFQTLTEISASRRQAFADLSHEAWTSSTDHTPPKPSRPPADADVWLVGAYWPDDDPPDQTQRFLDDGVWRNGYDDRLLDEVRSIRVGDRIAIKAASTQRNDLPFDARHHTVSCMTIKGIGTVTANRGDGRTVEVEWDDSFEPRRWYFYTNRTTVWHLDQHDRHAQMLIRFIFDDEPQDYALFCDEWYGPSTDPISTTTSGAKVDVLEPYNVADMLAEGVFLPESELAQALDRLRAKKNLILQGPPGVGVGGHVIDPP